MVYWVSLPLLCVGDQLRFWGTIVTILSKILKLFALVESDNDDEARNAAMAAVRLIKEHRLLDGIRIRKPANYNLPPRSMRSRRADLQLQATQKVGRFVAFLRRKADCGSYPAFEVRSIVNRAVKEGSISPADSDAFLYYMRKSIRERMKNGTIEYIPGKGYRLKPILMWENAA